MPEPDWGALLDSLSLVESMGSEDTGLLSFGEAPLGAIFVERGRICWVAARGLQRRLRDLLRQSSSIDQARLDRLYERCRSEGLFFGQTLVAEGLLQASELRVALSRHSAESLAELCHSGAPTSWSSHVGRGYAPQFTFRAADLLLETIALYYPDQQRAAAQELKTFTADGCSGAAFAFNADRELLLPLAQIGDASVEMMRALADSASPLPRASRELGSAPSFTLSRTPSGSTLLIWWRDELLFSVCCEDKTSAALATARHLGAQ